MLLLMGVAAYGQISLPAPGDIDTVAGYGTAGYSGDNGLATAADLNGPHNVAVDAAGNIYIADMWNNRIRKVTASTGIVTTVAGNGTPGYSGDGGAATSAELYYPSGVAVDVAGNLYIADAGNNLIRKVMASTGDISTVAGNRTESYSGDGGPATCAEMNTPYDVAVDASGNIYISDSNNNRVRKVTVSSGIITTVAGTGIGSYSGDGGPATSANISQPMGLVLDAAGNIYFADWGNVRIRKVAASTGIITTMAGNGSEGYSGDGVLATAAQLYYPYGVALDAAGNIYIADDANNRIRKVTASTGDISTVAGNGTAGYSGDGGAATSGKLKYPYGVAVDTANNIYIADEGNNRIRAVGQVKATPSMSVSCSPNPIPYGSETTDCTATVSGGATGTTTWTINGGAWTTQTLSGGTASAGGFNGYAAGSYAIGVTYNGDSNNNATSTSTTLTISKATPSISDMCSPNPISYGGSNSICTGYASDSGTVTGTLSFTINGAAWATETLSSGSATAPQFISTYGIGTYTVGVAYSGDVNNNPASSSTTLTISKANQRISFTAPTSPVTYGVSAITLSATASSGLAVTFSVSSGPCTVSGSILTVTGAGTCVVTANQGGNADYSAAAQVTQSVTVNAAVLTVTATSASRVYGVANPAFSYTVSGYVNGDTSSVVGGSAAETTIATSSSAPSSYSITFSTEGLKATNYTFSYVSGTLTVTQASQSITFNAPASPVAYGVSPISLSATANSGLAVTFSVSSGPCSVSGSTLTVAGAGTCVVAANQAGNADYTAAAAVSRSIVVNAAVLTITANNASRSYGVANPIFTQSYSGFVNGDTSSVLSGAPSLTTTATSTSAPSSYSITAAVGTLTASNYTFSFVNGTLTVTAATQTISFTAPASPVNYGVSPIALNAAASSGVAVTFSVSSGPCTVSGSTLTVIGAGTCVVAANQAGNSDYSAAAQVTQSVTVNQAALTVTANSASRAYGVANPTLGYTVTGYVNGDTLSIVGGSAAETTSATSSSAPGSYSITFSSEALTATNYTFSYVGGTLTVSQASQTITFNAPVSPVTYGVTPISLSATANSGLVITFNVSSGPCSVSGSTLTVTGAGTCVVAANQAGNTDYTAATTVSHRIVVNAAVLTVTGNNASRVYGAANPNFTASFSGFVNGDTSSVLSGAPSLTTTATPTSAPGSYTIISAAGTLAASNYTFSFANGTLTVTSATQTITFTAPVSPVAYGVSPISLSAMASSGLAVSFSVSSGPCTSSGNTLTVAGAGTCVVAANQPGNADYTAAVAVVQSLVINKESVIVNSTSSLSPAVYGDSVALTFTLTGSGTTSTGTVTISDGANTLATISLDAGIATYNTSALIAGKHTLTVVYSGDNNYQ
jgi:sugar lactone lactonase YvrE